MHNLWHKFGFHGAEICFQGQRVPRFAINLPAALANPSIVSTNLEKEISLGRVAGPFDSPPFSNFQVSPIGIVPKKNSNKLQLIFHLSFPKSAMTSINSAISKDDFSLQYVTIDDAIEGIKHFGPGCFLAKTDIGLSLSKRVLCQVRQGLATPDKYYQFSISTILGM